LHARSISSIMLLTYFFDMEAVPMEADEFPLESVLVVSFPCYLVRNEGGSRFVCHQCRNNWAVALLTDEDSLNRYRHDIGLPERGAARFNTLEQLLGCLQGLPPEVTHICLDIQRQGGSDVLKNVHLLELNRVREELAAQVGKSA
jgi:hypothetical protein